MVLNPCPVGSGPGMLGFGVQTNTTLRPGGWGPGSRLTILSQLSAHEMVQPHSFSFPSFHHTLKHFHRSIQRMLLCILDDLNLVKLTINSNIILHMQFLHLSSIKQISESYSSVSYMIWLTVEIRGDKLTMFPSFLLKKRML